ncbi:chorismate mutase [Saccharopolyspora antimicrobica]|uniref:Chorismate mutase n=1 Tax=Saccharopolyspora antimicrobica TaxID=455193 RepID=A0A1I5GP56_9PSEU|nr:chorismate mutase family protein [Saccharopolyspora antimicrobica]RKT87422.1 chorismate mutase [Saccharopolyspora antimicrobica]SFO37854.1 chorismate mutase [Saccharopolyspora antimicrobica]
MAENSAESSPLTKLRGELDNIDERLLDIVRERIDCCVRIARHKNEHGIPMMQPHRIGIVQERAANYGRAHDVDPDFLRRLYDLIIGETCRVEDIVMGNSPSN